jgi:hypothetical protein
MCDTCQDCDNLTLPAGTSGTDGEQGIQGIQGIQGDSGVGVLHNDLLPGTSITMGSYAVFTNDKLYNVPIGSLSADGDKLEVIAMFSTISQSSYKTGAEYQMLIGGTDIAGTQHPRPYHIKYSTNTNTGAVGSNLRVKLDISRINSTTLLVHSDSYASTPTGSTLNTYHFSVMSLTVADLDTTALSIQTKGQVYTPTISLTCNQLNINTLTQ